jgi:hypothetical protein
MPTPISRAATSMEDSLQVSRSPGQRPAAEVTWEALSVASFTLACIWHVGRDVHQTGNSWIRPGFGNYGSPIAVTDKKAPSILEGKNALRRDIILGLPTFIGDDIEALRGSARQNLVLYTSFPFFQRLFPASGSTTEADQEGSPASECICDAGTSNRADCGANQDRADHQLDLSGTEAEVWPNEQNCSRDQSSVISEQASAHSRYCRGQDNETRHDNQLPALARDGRRMRFTTG